MQPALKAGDRILISRDVRRLGRGDIIVFYHPKEQSKSYIKRIVGLPGETIQIRGGTVLTDGSVLEEPYVVAENNRQPSDYGPVKLPRDNFYVMGDNRDYSTDSRSWGTVPRTHIYGKFMSKYAEAK